MTTCGRSEWSSCCMTFSIPVLTVVGQVESAPPRGGSENSTVLRQLPPVGPVALYLWAKPTLPTQHTPHYKAKQQRVADV